MNEFKRDFGLKEHDKLHMEDFLFIIMFLIAEMGTFGLPLNAYQFVLLLLLCVLILRNLRSVIINKGIILLFLYMGFITFIGQNDFESYKGLIFFFLEIVCFYVYLKTTTKNKVYYFIYSLSTVSAYVGIVQEIGYLIGNERIYSLFGLSEKIEVRAGILAVSSLCAEPSHCAPIVACGLFIGLIGKEKGFNFVSEKKTVIILIFGIITMSLMTYISMITVFTLYYLFGKKAKHKLEIICVGVVAIVILLLFDLNLVSTVFSRLSQFKTMSTTTANDLSALALVSNLRVAIEKTKDGYLFGTGFDSHRILYQKYISQIYGTLYMYLNSEDAGSLYIRILSEFGLVGLLFFLVINAFKFHSFLKAKNIEATGFIIIFLVITLRDGQYQSLYSAMLFIMSWFVKDYKGKDYRESLINIGGG